ncbi:MAG TPA: DUF4229 domain-containing protein [Mycobacteriales bacterium]|nr:DUF4229 domain-containing protein [Mycobacteriales bacterium]
MQGSAARSVVAYNLGRLGLFVGCAVLGYVAGLRGLILLAAALLVSGVLSWFLLARQRAAMAEALGGAVTRSRSKLAQRTADEDAYADAVQRAAVLSSPAAPQPPIPVHEDVTRPDR